MKYNLKLSFIFTIMIMFSLASVSAAEWDNTKIYDPIKQEIVFKDTFLHLFPTGDIAKATLLTPHVYGVIPGKDRLVAKIQLEAYYDYPEFIKGMELTNINTGEKFDREITYKYLTIETYTEVVEDYKQSYDVLGKEVNGTDIVKSKFEKVGTHNETKTREIWTPLEKLDLKTENITIGLFTDVLATDNVEWVPTMFGMKVTEWAVWTNSLNVRLIEYWTLNETVPNNVYGSYGVVNFTNRSNLKYGNTTAMYGTAITTSNGMLNSTVISEPRLNLGVDNFTVSMWLRPVNSWSTNEYFFQLEGRPADSNGALLFERRNSDTGGAGYLWVYVATNCGAWADEIHSTLPISQNKWNHIVVMRNTSTWTVYVNGTSYKDVIAGTLANNCAGATTKIGSYAYSAGFFNGNIDEVAIWNRSMTPTEISDLYNSHLGLTWKADEYPSISVDQYAPIPWENFSTNSITFGCNYSTAVGAVIGAVNISVYNSSGYLAYQNTINGLTDDSYNATWTTTLPSATYNWTCRGYGTDGVTNVTSGNQTFTVDYLAPFLRIDYPANTTYNYNVTQLNFTCYDNDEFHKRPAWYSYDKGATNISLVDCATNITGMNSTEGSNTWMLSANDSFGNLNISYVTFWKDTLYPNIVYNESGMVAAGGYASQNYIFINTTWTETNFFNISFDIANSSNYAWNQVFTEPVYNWTLSGLTDGFYSFNVTICDTIGNCNMTPTRNITLDTVAPDLEIVYPQNTTYNYNVSQLNYTVSDLNPLTATCIYMVNGAPVPIITGENATDLLTLEGSNTFNITCSDEAGNQNVSGVSFVKDTKPIVNLTAPDDGYITLVPEVQMNCSARSGTSYITNLTLWTNQTGSWVENQTQTVLWSNLTEASVTSVGFAGIKMIYVNNVTVENYTNEASGGAGAEVAAVYFYTDGTDSGYINDIGVGAWVELSFPNPDPANPVEFVVIYGKNSGAGGTIYSRNDRVWAAVQNSRSPANANMTFYDNITAATLWSCSACDELGVCGYASTNRSILTDPTPPTIAVTWPTGNLGLYTPGSNTTTNYTITDTNLQTCWYVYNGVKDYMDCAGTYHDVNLTANIFNVTVYANDSFGNENSLLTSWFYSAIVNSTIFNATTYQTTNEGFILNLTSINETFTNPTATLIYDGTTYTPTRTGAGSTYVWTYNIAPITNGTKSFQWNVSMNSTYNLLTQSYSQVVSPITLKVCNDSDINPFVNFSFKDEISLAAINGSIELTAQYSIGGAYKSLSYTNTTQVGSWSLCFSPPDKTITVNISSFKYSSTGYPSRTYSNILTLTNQTLNVTLYSLATASGISSSYHVVDEAMNSIAGVKIVVTKGGLIVGSGLTDSSGTLTFFLDPTSSHDFVATKTGYQSKSFSIIPTQALYTIAMSSTASTALDSTTEVQGVTWQVRPGSGTVNTGLTQFNATVKSYNGNLIRCQLRLLNTTNTSQIFNYSATDATNGSYCYTGFDFPVVKGQKYFGQLGIWTTNSTGYVWVDSDWKWVIYDKQNSSFSSVLSMVQDLTEYNGFGTDANEAEFSRLMFFFLMVTILVCLLTYFTQFEFSNQGASLYIIWGIIAIASLGGFFETPVYSPIIGNKYHILIIYSFFMLGNIINYFRRQSE